MYQEKSFWKKAKEYIRSYFTLPCLLGGAAGTALGYWGSLTTISLYDIITSKIPQAIQTGNLSIFLYSNYWDVAGKVAFASGIAGLILARRIERSTVSFLKKVLR